MTITPGLFSDPTILVPAQKDKDNAREKQGEGKGKQ